MKKIKINVVNGVCEITMTTEHGVAFSFDEHSIDVRDFARKFQGEWIQSGETFTFDEICESQEFDHDQQFMKL